eukprot:6858248-Alexandrium_andersonii.AAC.1
MDLRHGRLTPQLPELCSLSRGLRQPTATYQFSVFLCLEFCRKATLSEDTIKQCTQLPLGSG